MTALSVRQDFYAGIFAMNACAVLNFPIEQKMWEESKVNVDRYAKKVIRTNAFSPVRECMIGVFIKKKIKSFLISFDEILTKTKEAIRPNRSYPRNHKQKKPKPMNYKKM